MRALAAVAVLLTTLLAAGCASPTPGASTAEAASPERLSEVPVEFVGEPWNQSGNVSLGWVAGVGADTWLGDGTLGLTSHEVCPRAMFVVPRSAKGIELTWDAPTAQADRPGAGYYTLVVSNPEAIYFFEPQVPLDQAWPIDPVPGVWELEVQARGAAANLLWTVHVQMSGEGPLEPPLEFFHDGDCM